MTFSNGLMYGQDILCYDNEKTPLATWSGQLSSECGNCFCFCDESGEKSDRYFSLRDVTSDIAANKYCFSNVLTPSFFTVSNKISTTYRIVTGVAIQKVNRVIQFVICERELLPFAKSNATLRRKQIWKDNSIAFLKDGQQGIDYYTLTRENRSINLDTVILPRHKVVTGVRFAFRRNCLCLEIRATDFDYVMGKLKNVDQSTWINNNMKRRQREEITMEAPNSPLRTTNIQERFDSNNKFIKFRPTDVKKDLAQLTVPFFESFQLEASDPAALSGIGN